jgi:hypothetical protein
MNPATLRWNIVPPMRKTLSQADLDRGQAISDELMKKARAAMERIAAVDLDEPDGADEDELVKAH